MLSKDLIEFKIILEDMPKKLTNKEVITRFKAKHGDKYGYGRVKYKGSHVKVEIYCREYRKYFWQTPGSHLQGRGCPRCAPNSKISDELIIKIFSELLASVSSGVLTNHKALELLLKDTEISYSGLRGYIHKKVGNSTLDTILLYLSELHPDLRNVRAKFKSSSIGYNEKLLTFCLENLLNPAYYKVHSQFKLGRQRVDIVIEDCRLAKLYPIEINGEQHYKNIYGTKALNNIKRLDKRKRKLWKGQFETKITVIKDSRFNLYKALNIVGNLIGHVGDLASNKDLTGLTLAFLKERTKHTLPNVSELVSSIQAGGYIRSISKEFDIDRAILTSYISSLDLSNTVIEKLRDNAFSAGKRPTGVVCLSRERYFTSESEAARASATTPDSINRALKRGRNNVKNWCFRLATSQENLTQHYIKEKQDFKILKVHNSRRVRLTKRYVVGLASNFSRQKDFRNSYPREYNFASRYKFTKELKYA